jgi:lariat debranching enzyme
MACPPKYRHMTGFPAYYTGAKLAPYLTVFIGGNHEASNYLGELPYGGWVAPRIYYLGHAGVVRVGGLRLAGLSGIYNPAHYQRGHYERPPYDAGALRSVYHVRECDAFRLSLLTGEVHVGTSHDWPAGIARHGDLDALLRAKPFLRNEVQAHTHTHVHMHTHTHTQCEVPTHASIHGRRERLSVAMALSACVRGGGGAPDRE